MNDADQDSVARVPSCGESPDAVARPSQARELADDSQQNARQSDVTENFASRPKLRRPTELPPHLRPREKLARFPRTRRWLRNLTAILLLLLFIANYWLWWRGCYGKTDRFTFPHLGVFHTDIIFSGCNVTLQLTQFDYNDHAGGWVRPESSEIVASVYRPIGFSSDARTRLGVQIWGNFEAKFRQPASLPNAWRAWVSVPNWFVQATLAVLLLWWLWKWVERYAEKEEAKK
jgi:hypothetical protein